MSVDYVKCIAKIASTRRFVDPRLHDHPEAESRCEELEIKFEVAPGAKFDVSEPRLYGKLEIHHPDAFGAFKLGDVLEITIRRYGAPVQ